MKRHVTSIKDGCSTDGLLIGELSHQTGLPTKTLRYYERIGLLETPMRTGSGYRIYPAAAVERLRFIQGAKVLGLSLAEIQEALSAQVAGQTVCSTIQHLVEKKMSTLDEKITDLIRYRDQLRDYMARVNASPGSDSTTCRHVGGVGEGGWTPSAPVPREEIQGGGRKGCCPEEEDE